MRIYIFINLEQKLTSVEEHIHAIYIKILTFLLNRLFIHVYSKAIW